MTDESLFAAALEKPSAAERRAFLDTVCASDSAQRQRLDLLEAADPSLLVTSNDARRRSGSQFNQNGRTSRQVP